MFTAAQCRAKALEKISQAKLDKRHRRRLLSAAEAWLFLAAKVDDVIVVACEIIAAPDVDDRAA